MRKIFNFWPILCFIFFWFLFASPYFISGKVPFPSTYQVDFFPPWSSYNERFPSLVKNNAMPDIISQIYPWKHFTIEQVKRGTLPFWNPYSFAGNPHLANSQSAVLSPFNLLYFLLPFIDAWSIIILLQPLLAGLFTYLFMRHVQVSKPGALLAGITFSFCGFMTVWMAYGTLGMAIVFLPLTLFAIEKSFLKKNPWYFLLVSFCITISIFSGHVQTSLYLILFSIAYFLFTAARYRTWRLIVFGLLSFVLGFFISLLQIYPTLQLYAASVRSESLHVGGGIPWNYLVTVFAPDFYGNPVTRNDWFGTYAEWASFIGIVPLLFALISWVDIRKNQKICFFVISGSIALLLSMDTPIHSLLIATRLPVIATSIPSRIIILFSFSFAILAGFGLDVLEKILREREIKKIVPAVGSLGGLLSVMWLLLLVFHVLPNDKNQLSIALKNSILPTALFFSACGVTAFFYYISKLKKSKLAVNFVIAILLLLAGFDSYRFAAKWMPFDPREFVYPDIPVIRAMQKGVGDGRVFGNLGTQVETYYGIPSLEGYDPLYIERYGEFIQYANYQRTKNAERSVVTIDRRGVHTERVLDLLGVTHIFHPIADTNQNWAFPVWENTNKYSEVYRDEKFQLFRNNQALPRAKVFYTFEVISDGRLLLKKLFDQSFDYRNTLLLEQMPQDIRSQGRGTGDARIVVNRGDKVVVEVKTDKQGLLFLSDTYFDAWRATVNNKEERIYRANYAFRAVVVPAGRSTVVFAYTW